MLLHAQLHIIQPAVIITPSCSGMEFVLNQEDLPPKGERIGDLHGAMWTAERVIRSP